MSAYDDATLRRIASGDDTPREYRTLSRELATEVLRLRERVARADGDAAGYLADHATAVLDLAAATARAEKAEAERDALRAAAQEFLTAQNAFEKAWREGVYPDRFGFLGKKYYAARERLRALAGEGGR